jgi:hypothetical protein
LPYHYRIFLQILRSRSLSDLVAAARCYLITNQNDRNHGLTHYSKIKTNNKKLKPNDKIICYRCKEPGHTANVCRDKGHKKKITAIRKDSFSSGDEEELNLTDETECKFQINTTHEDGYLTNNYYYFWDTEQKINFLKDSDKKSITILIKFPNIDKPVKAQIDIGLEFNVID